MAAHAPSHILIDVSLDLVHLANLSVTGNTIDICLYVWFVGKEGIGGSRYPVDSDPRRLLMTFGIGSKFLDFRAVGFYRLVASHAGRCIGYCGMRRLISIFMAKGAFQLRAVRLCNVQPVVVGDWLSGGIGPCRAAQLQEPADQDQYNYNRSNLYYCLHLVLIFLAQSFGPMQGN